MDDNTGQDQAAPSGKPGDWFECDDGWAPLITALEAKLKALAPDYTVSKVKEKFGGLRLLRLRQRRQRGDRPAVL